MPQINVTIDGKNYRMACGEGEEDHLTELAATLDSRIGDMRRAFGEIGDMRLHVMAALTVVDELAELKRRMGALEAEAAGLRALTEGAEAERSEREARLAEGVARAAERIERLAQALAAGA
ncbi:cell division protein ZapA [Methylobacterium oxalidis]|uniref:Cell division protein ZapA n=1 Tax=Methylobacterium oxalidis TaxID=944322 RepID=A0A512IZ00_9HYPH|nr:cell division protein ZapA [Methylobacterium oxalidis]GEP02944.1 cell division protein ZapA [Methylobacterium oxalidis]GJE30269.1 Cell division protein ZapA [Methylobacterium oxalidis]GLS65877.1 cell division protein ZapA [Methylobacterium oxalidis]